MSFDKRCVAIVYGRPCNVFHHTLLHPEETKNDVPAEPLREKPAADQDLAVTSSTAPVPTPQAATPQLEDIELAILADELYLEEITIPNNESIYIWMDRVWNMERMLLPHSGGSC